MTNNCSETSLPRRIESIWIEQEEEEEDQTQFSWMNETLELPFAPKIGLSTDSKGDLTRIPSKMDGIVQDDQLYFVAETKAEESKSRKKLKSLDQSKHSTKSSKSKKKGKKKKKSRDERSSSLKSLPNLELESTKLPAHKKVSSTISSRRRASIGNCSRNSVFDSSHFHASITDRSDITADTEPSTPSTLKMTVDLSRHMSGLEANIETFPTNFPAISEEPAKSKKNYKVEKDSTREKEKKSKDKKKSKKDKKKKKGKDKEKNVKKKGKGTLVGSQRTISSFGSSRSFGSQRSLGSYVNDPAGEGLIGFVAVQTDSHPLGTGRRGTRKRVIPKGSRTVPLVSMPESAVSPDLTRKKFNDNNKIESSHSFSSFTPASPPLVDAPLSQFLTKDTSTPTSTTASVCSKGSMSSKYKMIPKSQSFSFRKALRSPARSNPLSSPSSKDASSKGSGDELDLSKQNLPMTKYCSAPKATHPNKAVGKAWKSPFDADVKYLEPEEEEHFVDLKGSNEKGSPTKSEKSCDDESQHSQIDEWDYGPSALLRKNDGNGNTSKSSLYYDHDDDVSALTMSFRTERKKETSPRRMRACSRGTTIIETGEETPRKSYHSRSRSPTPPRSGREERLNDEIDLKRSQSLDGALLKRKHSFDTSGEEGSISLHDSSVRVSSPIDKTQGASRQSRFPTVPRFTTPPRIRFGEGQSDPTSPRPRDQRPSVPERVPSEHKRGNEDEDQEDVLDISAIPMVEEVSDSDDRKVEDRTSKVVDNFDDNADDDDDDDDDDDSKETPTDESDVTPTSHTVFDDADAAAGKKSPVVNSKWDKSPGRVNHLIKNFEAMDSNCIPIQSPSFYKRKPKNLKPIPPEARDVPATMMVLRSPSLPSPTSPTRPTRNASGPLLPRLSKKNKDDIDSAHCSPVANKSPLGRTKMTVKPMSPSPFDLSDDSFAKEVMQGSFSDWVGSPKKVIRDTSYNESETDEQDNVAKTVETPAKRRKSTGKKETKSERRRSIGKDGQKAERRSSVGSHGSHTKRRGSVGKSEEKSKRRSSVGNGEGKAERKSSIGSYQATPKRRTSIGNIEGKSERKKSIVTKETKSERRRSIGNNEGKADLRSTRDSTDRSSERSQASPRRRSRTPENMVRSSRVPKSPGNIKPSSFKKRSACDRSRSPGSTKPSSFKKRCSCDRSRSPGNKKPSSLTQRGSGDRSRSPGNSIPNSFVCTCDRSRSPGNSRPSSLTNRSSHHRSRSPGNTKPSSLTKRSNHEKSKSPGNTKPSSLTKRNAVDELISPRKTKPSSLTKRSTTDRLNSPRKTKLISPKKKQVINTTTSPKKVKPIPPRKTKQPMTVNGATGTPVGVSPVSTPLERVKKIGKGLLGLTPGSTHSTRDNSKKHSSPRIPDPPLTAKNSQDIPTTITAPRRLSNSDRSTSPSRSRSPSRQKSRNTPLSPPPKNSFFSKNRLKDRAYLSGNRGGWGGDKAKLQRKREKERKKSHSTRTESCCY